MIFSLTATNESLEEKCDDLRKQIEDLSREVEIERRKNERLQLEQRTNKDEMAVVMAAANAAAALPSSNSRCSRDTNVSVILGALRDFSFFVSQWMMFQL